MLISEVVEILQKIKLLKGDLQVCIDATDVVESFSEEFGYMSVNTVEKTSCPWDDGDGPSENEVDIVSISIL